MKTDEQIWNQFRDQFIKDFPTLALYDTEDTERRVKRAIVAHGRQFERLKSDILSGLNGLLFDAGDNRLRSGEYISDEIEKIAKKLR